MVRFAHDIAIVTTSEKNNYERSKMNLIKTRSPPTWDPRMINKREYYMLEKSAKNKLYWKENKWERLKFNRRKWTLIEILERKSDRTHTETRLRMIRHNNWRNGGENKRAKRKSSIRSANISQIMNRIRGWVSTKNSTDIDSTIGKREKKAFVINKFVINQSSPNWKIIYLYLRRFFFFCILFGLTFSTISRHVTVVWFALFKLLGINVNINVVQCVYIRECSRIGSIVHNRKCTKRKRKVSKRNKMFRIRHVSSKRWQRLQLQFGKKLRDKKFNLKT